MGVKMGVAFDSAGQEWSADIYRKGLGTPPLKCKFCPAPVSHNPAHPREWEDKSILIPAYFRLHPGGIHAENCRFAVTEKIQLIVKESKELFETIREGDYRLRLVMIKQALEALSGASRQSCKGERQTGARAETSYAKSPAKLAAYINSAKRVLQLRALCDDDVEIANHLKLVFEGNTVVRWPEFYFETERYLEAFNAIAKNTVEYPIALHGYVKTKRLNTGKNGRSNVLNLERNGSQQDLNDPDNGINAEASVWSHDPSWFTGIEAGDEIVVFGLWKTSPGAPKPANTAGRFKTFTTKKLNLTLVVTGQIAKVPNR
jgi:hypothetical protein